jgi:hypothetical protein
MTGAEERTKRPRTKQCAAIEMKTVMSRLLSTPRRTSNLVISGRGIGF